MEEPTTLFEAIEAANLNKIPENDIRSVTFDPPLLIVGLGSGNKVSRYNARDKSWRNWTVAANDKGVTLCDLVSGRSFFAPMSRCAVEYGPSCPKCGTPLKGKTSDGRWRPCPGEKCAWPRDNPPVCPECASQIPEGRTSCPNPSCKWGYEEPEDAVPTSCDVCNTKLTKDGECPLCGRAGDQAKKKKGGKK